MAKERSLEVTPTWAIAVVCFVLLAISLIVEHLIHLVAHWLKKKHKNALYEAVEKVKAELMLLGFISLLLTVGQSPISKICVPRDVAHSWHPCNNLDIPDSKFDDPCLDSGKVTLVSAYGIHQLHIFIFFLACFHVIYCITTLGLGRLKMRKWRSWEDETKTIEYQYSHDPERFRFARETTFGRRHLSVWSKSPTLLSIGCFFRQFYTSVAKVDYLTLRNGFINAHLAPQSQMSFDFNKYIRRSLEEDFKVVVGISPVLWLFAVLLLLTNTHGLLSYLWLPFIPLVIILAIGTKLQMIITEMGLRIHDMTDVVKGAPTVRPGDELFWFGRPRLILLLINFVLFQNAFQLAFFIWSWYEFGYPSCYHHRIEDLIIRIAMGVLIQVVCSYVTLPLYALVTQMGSSMRPAIFSEQIATAIKNWRHNAKQHVKHSHHSGHTTPYSSRPGTPSRNTSPLHLLHSYPHTQDSLQSPPRGTSPEDERWADEYSRHSQYQDDESSIRDGQKDEGEIQQPNFSRQLPAETRLVIPGQRDFSDFSFVERV